MSVSSAPRSVRFTSRFKRYLPLRDVLFRFVVRQAFGFHVISGDRVSIEVTTSP